MGRDHPWNLRVTLLLVLLAVGVSACSDDGVNGVGPHGVTPPPGNTRTGRAALACTATLHPLQTVCKPIGGGAKVDSRMRRYVVVGKQNVYVTFATSGYAFQNDTFSFSATIQNLMTQPIGTQNGSTLAGTGVDAFFTAGPSSETGVGTVTPVGTQTGTFTASGQKYYEYAQVLQPNATSTPLTWKFLLSAGVTSFNFYIEVAGDMPAEGSVYRWTSLLQGVSGNQLNSVWQDNSSDVYAAGVNGTVLHYNGTTWSALALNQPTYQLNSVYGSSGTDVWVVGNAGVTAHYNGSAFTTVATASTNNLTGVWESSSTNVYAVGYPTGTTNSIVYQSTNGTSWTAVAPPHGVVDSLFAVWGSDASHVFMVGHDGRILMYNGSAWTAFARPTTSDLRAVWGTSATNVFTVGDNGVIYQFTGGTTWTAMTSTTTNALYGVGGSSGSDIWAVGQYGTTVHYNGTAWDTVQRVMGMNLHGVVSGSTTPWAVGDNGTIAQYGGSIWAISPQSGLSYKRIWASSANDIWVSAEGTLRHYNGTTWSSIWVSPADTMIGLGGFSSTDVHSLGQQGSVAIYNGTGWTLNNGANGVGNQGWTAEFGVADTALCAVAINGEYLCNTSGGGGAEANVATKFLSLWGPAALTLYAGTTNGVIYKATNAGAGWTWTTQTSPTTDSIYGMYGTSATAIWGCGQAGTIIANTGTATWTAQTSGTSASLKALWANPTPPSGYTADVYAVGDGGVIQHYNGTAWTAMTSGVTTPLRTVWGLATTNVYAAGDNGVILLGTQ